MIRVDLPFAERRPQLADLADLADAIIATWKDTP